MKILGIDHVQIAMPPGREEEARAFFVGVLGLAELPKPANLVGRGGCWFAVGGGELHLGVEEPFAPARKAHVALSTDGLAELEQRLIAAGHRISHDAPLAGCHRFFTDDPFGNRLELLQRGAAA